MHTPMMDSENTNQVPDQVEHEAKQPFVEPRLKFVAPKLVKQGDAAKLTRIAPGGFFGSFSP
jgi:hypothetical protein